jgi:predicted transcriptional regulator YdeE
MEPELVEHPPMLVAGITTRTSKAEEARASRAKIPGLWARFASERVADVVPYRVPGTPVYGVYTEYEADASAPYRLMAGVAVRKPASAFDTVRVAGGQYLVFEGTGPVPHVVAESWARVWAYFATSREHRRTFTTDFEVYRGPEQVAIYIAVT